MNKTILFVSMAMLFAIQACGGGGSEETGDIDKGPLANDPHTTVSSKGRGFFCDFKWTQGKKRWNYDANGEKEVENSEKANEPWCLIPYDSTASYAFSFILAEGVTHYACRDRYESFYEIGERHEEIEKNIYYGELRRLMNCVSLEPDKSVNVSAVNYAFSLLSPKPDFINNRLYYVTGEKGVYNIKGHLNLKLVKPVELSAIMLIYLNGAVGYKSIGNNQAKDTIIQHLQGYLAKAGYTLNVDFVNVEFPARGAYNFPGMFDIIQHTDVNPPSPDGMVTIPEEVIEVSKYIARNYNYNYIIGITPTYSNKFGLLAETYEYDDAVFGIRSLTLTDESFFNYDAEKKARQLAALLYSKIIGKNPLDGIQDQWLSTYYFAPRLDVSQPSKDWEKGRQQNIQQQLMEFALLMQNFK
ncbi:MAG: hypothetical protein LBC85_08025 [Fibromonadaceae bacterium]|jgi:hypothetical protein|nr:hypothetical protein [Fibromonadaceae bacterium]